MDDSFWLTSVFGTHPDIDTNLIQHLSNQLTDWGCASGSNILPNLYKDVEMLFTGLAKVTTDPEIRRLVVTCRRE